ncbi:uncharacterized protein (UPF0335 family) [Sphingomonas sp. BE123]|nr:uncharacterized protein (UPF0335 family) [Sphingomonas sp. BE123]
MSEAVNAEALYQDALALVVTHQKASTSWLQRQMRLGYNSASRLIERMQSEGILSVPNHIGARSVLITDLAAASAASVRAQLVAPAPTPEPSAPSPVGAQRAQSEKTMSDSISAEQLRLLIERIERLEEEKKGISEDIKDVYGEAKATGFDAKIMRTVIRLRKMEKHQLDEQDALLETYRAALGMG